MTVATVTTPELDGVVSGFNFILENAQRRYELVGLTRLAKVSSLQVRGVWDAIAYPLVDCLNQRSRDELKAIELIVFDPKPTSNPPQLAKLFCMLWFVGKTKDNTKAQQVLNIGKDLKGWRKFVYILSLPLSFKNNQIDVSNIVSGAKMVVDLLEKSGEKIIN